MYHAPMSYDLRTIRRYVNKIDMPLSVDKCWEWTAYTTPRGYGMFNVPSESSSTGMRSISAHRFSYEIHYGPIPEGLVVDHLCFNRLCQNPRHLRLLTAIENSLRENRKPIDACKNGHEFTEENTTYHTKTGARVCVICAKEYKHQWYSDRREAISTERKRQYRQKVFDMHRA
jgi:hypothetical protein